MESLKVDEQSNQDKKAELVGIIKQKLQEVNQEVESRNEYMNERDDLLYDSDYIMEDLDIPEGFDTTKYNFLPRAVEIHTSQAMGRGFEILPVYNKIDTSPLEGQDLEMAELKNNELSQQGESAKKELMGLIHDNGGNGLWSLMASTGSSYGLGLIKMWPEDKTVKMVAIESPQMYRAGWAGDNFRERDWDAFVYRMSIDSAYSKFGSSLKKGESFTEGKTNEFADGLPDQTSRKFVYVIDFVGSIQEVNDGKPFYAMIVGDKVVSYKTSKLPKYYLFPNKQRLRRPWPESDITDEAISINQTYIQTMSDYKSLLNEVLFPILKGKGFQDQTIPKRKRRKVAMIPMGIDQDIDVLQMNPITYPYDRILNEIKESLWRALRLGRVFVDDPSVSFESNQALMTGMKPTIDAAEDKQARWKPVIVNLLTDALNMLKEVNPDVRKTVGEAVDITIEWPSVLRKEDSAYNSMLFNDVSRSMLSLETYLTKKGIPDVQEEMERIKSELKDPILGAILSANTRTLNQMSLMGPLQSPQGQPGQQPTGAPLTPDQNQGTQPASAPGSGAPAVSPEGMMATSNQNIGM